MNYYETLIEVADDCPATKGQAPQARGGRKTKATVEYELLVKHPYTRTEEDIAFEVYAVLHDIPKASWPEERERFLSKGHPTSACRLWQSATGWGIHNDAEGKVALIAVESPDYKRLLNDPHTTKVRAFRWLEVPSASKLLGAEAFRHLACELRDVTLLGCLDEDSLNAERPQAGCDSSAAFRIQLNPRHVATLRALRPRSVGSSDMAAAWASVRKCPLMQPG